MQDDVRLVRAYIAQHLGDELVEWPGGWPGEVEVALAVIDPADLVRAVGSQRTGGELKAEAIVRAAEALVAAGVVCADHVRPADEEQKRAYTSVRGLGWVTWEYFGMLLGRPGVKADRWVIQAVSTAVERRVTAVEARDVVLATAHDMGESPTRLEHALWAFERAREDA
jgi:hypothetical protein